MDAARQSVDQQIVRFRRLEEGIETAFVDQADELCFGMEALQCRVLVVGVEGTMRDFSVLQVLNKVGREKTLPDAALAVNNEVDLFAHVKVKC